MLTMMKLRRDEMTQHVFGQRVVRKYRRLCSVFMQIDIDKEHNLQIICCIDTEHNLQTQIIFCIYTEHNLQIVICTYTACPRQSV